MPTFPQALAGGILSGNVGGAVADAATDAVVGNTLDAQMDPGGRRPTLTAHATGPVPDGSPAPGFVSNIP